jgi:hypothetical protein
MRNGGRMIRSTVIFAALTVTMLSSAACAPPGPSSGPLELVSRFTTYYPPGQPAGHQHSPRCGLARPHASAAGRAVLSQ